MSDQPKPFKKLTGLWENEKGYLSGKNSEDLLIPGGVYLYIFKSKFATGKQPTHELCVKTEDWEKGRVGGGDVSEETPY